MPDWKKLIEGKIALALKAKTSGFSLSKSSDDARVPAGQKWLTNFPVLDLGVRPTVNTMNWKLRIYGLVNHEINLDWITFRNLPQMFDTSDFHCVTRWSQLDMNWQGASARKLIMQADPKPEAKYVTLHGYDGYTTNLPLEALLDDDVIVAQRVLGKSLTAEHGGPARIIVPKRYA